MSGNVYDYFFNEETKQKIPVVCNHCGSYKIKRPAETDYNGFYCNKCNEYVEVSVSPIYQQNQQSIDDFKSRGKTEPDFSPRKYPNIRYGDYLISEPGFAGAKMTITKEEWETNLENSVLCQGPWYNTHNLTSPTPNKSEDKICGSFEIPDRHKALYENENSQNKKETIWKKLRNLF
ncbi:MAG: hypothetical protein WC979_02695 [Candidatus Pacearchaeota archaeon]|jgi:hypothetical protein|nr:hypothetical protein [Clostridia bacterium]